LKLNASAEDDLLVKSLLDWEDFGKVSLVFQPSHIKVFFLYYINMTYTCSVPKLSTFLAIHNFVLGMDLWRFFHEQD
jgi:hypothetical protein